VKLDFKIREEHEVRIFESRVQKRMDEVTGG
jgi:hypothetical protein